MILKQYKQHLIDFIVTVTKNYLKKVFNVSINNKKCNKIDA